MKRIKNKLVLVALLLGITSYANGKEKKGNLISVSDASGKVIYSAHTNSNINLKNIFDFSQLKEGRYTVEINKDFEIEINTIEVKNKTAKLLISDSKKVFKPVFRSENAKVLISKIAFDTDTIKVELYYENELILNETVKSNDAIINRIYKLDDTQTGNYKAIIKSNNRVFVERFKI